MSGVNAVDSQRPPTPAAPVKAQGQLAGQRVEPSPAQPPRRGTLPSAGSRPTPSLASRIVSVFTPRPAGNDFMGRLGPRELIVYRSVLANIAEASKDDQVKPEILSQRDPLGKRLGDWPARMLEAAGEFPAAIRQQASHPGSVEAAWRTLTDMAQSFLGEFARDNPKASTGINPHDPSQQRGIVSAMLNSFIRSGEMDEAGLKTLLGSLPHEEQQALLAVGKHHDTPVAAALLELCGEARTAFQENAAALMDPTYLRPDARAQADAVITAATNLSLFKHAAGVTGKKDSFEKSDPASAALATRLREYLEKLYENENAFKDLDVTRLHKLRSALKTFDANLDNRILVEAERRIAESTSACRASVDDAIKHAANGDMVGFTQALDKTFAANAELVGALRIKRGDGPGAGSDADQTLANLINAARAESPQCAALDAWLAKNPAQSLQRTLAGAGEASRSSPDPAEAAAGARMGGCAYVMGLLRGSAPDAALASDAAPLAPGATTAKGYDAIRQTFGVDLDTAAADSRCSSAFNAACRAASVGDTAKVLESLDTATEALSARLMTHRLAGHGTPSADMQQVLLGDMVEDSVRALPDAAQRTLRKNLQSSDMQALRKTLHEEADSLDKPGPQQNQAAAARKRAAAAYLEHLGNSPALASLTTKEAT